MTVTVDDVLVAESPAGGAASGATVRKERKDLTPTITHRIVLMVAAIGLFGPALIAWPSIVHIPAVGAVSTAACAAALGIVVAAAVCRKQRSLERLDWTLLALGVVVLVCWSITELYYQPAYGTDEAAFVQYSAQLLLHGHNPYRTNLLPALTQFRVPIQYATYKLNGTIASSLDYPSLSFLLVVPGALITHGVQSIIIENALALGIEMVLVFCFLPKTYRALSVVLVLGLSFLFDYTIAGDIITMSLPFLIVVAWRWPEIGRGGALGRGGVGRAICLGLAASICQFPWFVAPFLLVALWRLRAPEVGGRRAGGVVVRFALVTGATVLLVNSPFILWSPGAWFSGVMTPFTQKAIPFGQGLIDATAFLRLGGGNIDYYTVASVCVFVALLIVFSRFFWVLAAATFILPSVVFLFSTRSLSEYFIMMVAMWVVSAMSVFRSNWRLAGEWGPPVDDAERLLDGHRSMGAAGHGSVWAAAIAVPILATAAFVALALLSPAPLSIRVKALQSNGQLKSIWRISAEVTNKSSHALEPHFATDTSGYMTTFWNVVSGPPELQPHQRATYDLVAPNVGSMPGVTEPFVLQAVTAGPDTMSSSTLITPDPFTGVITPNYIDHIVPLGGSVSLGVQLRSPYGAPVHRSGVPVALGQVIYAQDSLIVSEARINGAPEGRSPVVAMTNAAGEAHFTVSDDTVQGGNPVYFQAYIDPAKSYPYGYSDVVSVQWEPRRRPPAQSSARAQK